MEQRLIDANALLDDGIKCSYGYNDNGVILIPVRDVRDSIKKAPTIEAEPVRHGRWIAQDNTFTRFMCSECKSKNHHDRSDYCPNCGAKMDLEG